MSDALPVKLPSDIGRVGIEPTHLRFPIEVTVIYTTVIFVCPRIVENSNIGALPVELLRITHRPDSNRQLPD